MASKTPWHIFYKCFRNQATREELAELNAWLEEDRENLKTLEEVYHIFSFSPVLPSVLTPDTQKAWQMVDREVSKKRTFDSLRRYVTAAVAVLVFGLMAAGTVHSYLQHRRSSKQFTEIVTQAGQKTSVRLPDGSTVWLNSSSSLKYPADFNSASREVIMTGEAFFQVKKDQSRTFRVISGTLNVEVHGTSFNVKNYSDENAQKITVADGLVGLVRNSLELTRLKKGEQAAFDKGSEKVVVTNENPDQIAAWRNNELIFRNTAVEDVIKSLESWYGVNITIDNRMHDEHNYSFRVKTESLREVLNMMAVMTPLVYTVSGKDIEIRYIN
jgi:ferric-dicitrate binding protein FerR (iron transport regulator)